MGTKYINVKIDQNLLFKALSKRVDYWVDDDHLSFYEAILYKNLYKNYIDEGYFEYMVLDIDAYVDNHIINDTLIMYRNEFDEVIYNALVLKWNNKNFSNNKDLLGFDCELLGFSEMLECFLIGHT